MIYKPLKHQRQAIKRCLSNPVHALFMAPGAGKTGIMLHTCKELKKSKQIKKVLVVGTKTSVYSTWIRENEKWNFGFSISEVTGSKDKKLNALKTDADIYLINYESFKFLWEHRSYLKGFDVLILDESSRIKSYRAKTTKTFLALAPQFKRRYILTGSPAPKSYIDLFSQIKFLDFGLRLGRYITQYRNEYFFPYGYKGYLWALSEGADTRIQKKITDICLTVSTDALDIPSLYPNIRRVHLPGEVYARQYLPMERNFIASLGESDSLTADSKAIAVQKLRQIANGFLYYRESVKKPPKDMFRYLKELEAGKLKEPPQKTLYLHEEKINELISILDELAGEKVLIGYEFKEDKKLIETALTKQLNLKKPEYEIIEGGITAQDIARIEGTWSTGETSILCAQIAKAAHGLNLQESGCHHIIMFSLTWNLENYEQFIRRILRPGQKSNKVILHLIMANNTIDEVVLSNLTAKDSDQSKLFNSFKEYVNEKEGLNLSNRKETVKEIAAHFIDHNTKAPIFDPDDPHGEFNFPYLLIQKIDTWSSKAVDTFLKLYGLSKSTQSYENKEQVRSFVFSCLGIIENNAGTFSINKVNYLDQFTKESLTMLSKHKRKNPIDTIEMEVATSEKPKPKKKVSKKKATAKKKVGVKKKKATIKKKVAKKKVTAKAKRKTSVTATIRKKKATSKKVTRKKSKR